MAIAAAVALIVGLLATLLGQGELWKPLAGVSSLTLVGLVVTSLGGLAIQSTQFETLGRIFGLRLRPAEALGLTCVNNMMSYSVPGHGGTLVRAAYLRQVHRLPLAGYAALTVSSNVCILTVVALAGAVLAPGSTAGGTVGGRVSLVMLTAPVVLLGGLWAVARLAGAGRRIARLARHAHAFGRGLASWRHHAALGMRFAVLSLGVFAAHGLRLAVALAAVGASATIADALVIQAAVALAAVMAFTPGNLGTKEGVVALMGSTLGIDPSLALLAALIDRAVAVAEALGGGMIFSRTLLHGISRSGPSTGARHVSDAGGD